MVTKSRSSKTKLGITGLTTLKPVWLFSQLLNEIYKRDRLPHASSIGNPILNLTIPINNAPLFLSSHVYTDSV